MTYGERMGLKKGGAERMGSGWILRRVGRAYVESAGNTHDGVGVDVVHFEVDFAFAFQEILNVLYNKADSH